MQRKVNSKMKQPKQLKNTLLGHKDVLKSVIIFLSLCFIFDFLYFWLAGDQMVQRTFTAALVAGLLKSFGLNAEAHGARRGIRKTKHRLK